MKLIAFALVGVATLAGVIALTAPAANQESAPIFVTDIPPGYRDWRLISVAHEEGNFHSFSAVLGNDLAIQAYREGKLPFPDGWIIAALHYRHVPSEENNKVLAKPNLSYPAPQRTFSLWSRTQKSTPQRAVGASLTSRTANLPTRLS
jgi:Cytochrome P460